MRLGLLPGALPKPVKALAAVLGGAPPAALPGSGFTRVAAAAAGVELDGVLAARVAYNNREGDPSVIS